MKPGLASDTTKSGKNLAKRIAKQVVREPIEILKQVEKQTIGIATPAQEEKPQPQEKEITSNEKAKIEAQGQRQVQALEKELKDIQVLKVQKGQAEIQEKVVAEKKKEEEKKPVVEPASKPGRRLFGFGQKAQAQKQQTHVEKILPPSG